MARRHWLDPIARQLLIASGQLPAERQTTALGAKAGKREEAEEAAETHDAAVDRELLALKLRHNPDHQLQSAAELADAAALGWRLDVNRAAAEDWARLPGLSRAQIDLLVRLQAGGVQLSGPEDLQRLLELPMEQVQRWLPVLVFRWYGEPPSAAGSPRLDINRASLRALQEWGLAPERCRRLLAERARRPFRDLADLQQRLQLPPALVEEWIGRVCFGDGRGGPQLPPGRGASSGR
jgi:DNA uptake protein ComE-like DNA-binding protein